MPESDYVFRSGNSIEIGSHGETDFVFHSGEPVPNKDKTGFVFERGFSFGKGALILDDFEDGDLTEYADQPNWDITTTALQGSYSARFTGGSTQEWLIDDGTSLGTVSRGMRFGVLVELDSTADSEVGILFGVQSEDVDNRDWINAEYSAEKDGDPMGIYADYRQDTTENEIVQDESITRPPSGTLLDFVLTWDDGSFGGSDGDITFEIYEGRYDDGGTLIDSVSGNDFGDRQSGGIGVTAQLGHSTVDLWRIIDDQT